MRSVFAILALAGAVSAQAVTAIITPTSPSPAGCTNTRTTPFELSIVSVANPHGKVKRQDSNGQLLMTLNDGVLKDSNGRTGYVASNQQFQFDKPPQAGAIYTAGFSICQNGTIALGGSAIWYSCSSGSKFDNLYEKNVGQLNCSEVYFYAANSGATNSGTDYPAQATSASTSAMTSAAASPTTMASSATMETSATSAAGGAPTVTPAKGAAAAMVVDTLAALAGAAGLVALL